MSPYLIALFTLIASFGGSIVGMTLQRHLPKNHLSKDGKDTMLMVIGVAATMTALLLGQMISSARIDFDATKLKTKQALVDLILLDQILEGYGTEAKPIRQQIKEIANTKNQIFNGYDVNGDKGNARLQKAVDNLAKSIFNLSPTDQLQKVYKERAIIHAEGIIKSNLLILAGVNNAIPSAFLLMLFFWIGAIFVCLGLYAPIHYTSITIFFISSLVVSGALFINAELNAPFEGLIQVLGNTDDPFHFATAILGK